MYHCDVSYLSSDLIIFCFVFQGDTFYLFFETKNSVTLQGDIGVAKSTDKGATWQHLGIALDEEWHLSYPYVFDYLGQVRPNFLSAKIHALNQFNLLATIRKWTNKLVLVAIVDVLFKYIGFPCRMLLKLFINYIFFPFTQNTKIVFIYICIFIFFIDIYDA